MSTSFCRLQTTVVQSTTPQLYILERKKHVLYLYLAKNENTKYYTFEKHISRSSQRAQTPERSNGGMHNELGATLLPEQNRIFKLKHLWQDDSLFLWRARPCCVFRWERRFRLQAKLLLQWWHVGASFFTLRVSFFFLNTIDVYEAGFPLNIWRWNVVYKLLINTF